MNSSLSIFLAIRYMVIVGPQIEVNPPIAPEIKPITICQNQPPPTLGRKPKREVNANKHTDTPVSNWIR